MAHGDRVDEPLTLHTNGTNYFYHTDGLGSIETITNTAGAVAQSYVYSSFGVTTIFNGAGTQISQGAGLLSPYAFTGRELDLQTGLYFYRARYYNPFIGRFLSEDPIGLRGGDLNLYRYVSNNPLNYTDPTGKFWASVATAVAIVVVTVVAVKILSAVLKGLPAVLNNMMNTIRESVDSNSGGGGAQNVASSGGSGEPSAPTSGGASSEGAVGSEGIGSPGSAEGGASSQGSASSSFTIPTSSGTASSACGT